GSTFQKLHAGRPLGLGKPTANGLLTQSELTQCLCRCYRCPRIHNLMAANQCRLWQIEEHVFFLKYETAPLLVGIEMMPPDRQRRTNWRGPLANDLERLVFLL